MYLREIAIYADPELAERYPGGFVARFHRDTCCVCESFTKALWKKLKTDRVPKIQFDFVNIHETHPSELHMLNIRWPFDFDCYVTTQSIESKKMQIGESLKHGMDWVSTQINWPSEIIDDAYHHAKATEFVLEGLVRPSWITPCGRFVVKVFARLDLQHAEFDAVVYSKGCASELGRKRIGVLLPETAIVDACIAHVRWESPTVFSLGNSQLGTHRIQVDLSDILTS